MNDYIARALARVVKEKFGTGKAIVIYGPRQVGKTTLLRTVFADQPEILWLNGDEEEVRATLATVSAASFQTIIGKNKTLIIDEAQRIDDIGLKLKIIQDAFGDKVQLIATGSSSFELANKVNEPLTGRKWEYRLLPLSFAELAGHHGLIAEKSNLTNRLLYGCYPDIVSHPEDAKDRLNLLARDNLYKDILKLDDIKKPNKLEKLLQALALQIGSQVSTNELAGLVGIDNKTVEKYLSLLEQSFIIFRLPSFARNLRNELSSSNKYYFYDLGIRNAVIDDFRPIELRQDIGGMFENYIISELQKNHTAVSKQYFWRTSQQQEVDYVYESNGKICATEIKWNTHKNPRLPVTFVDAYQPDQIFYINRDNYPKILLELQKM